MNILVVDDEPVIVKGIVKRIQKMENLFVQVSGAESGAQALEIMENFIPDLLITDIEMPEMDGFELLLKVKEKGLCRNFVILTAYEVFEYAKQAVHYHVTEYLVKPVDWNQLGKIIRELAMQPERKANIEQVEREFPGICADVPAGSLSHPLSRIVNYIKENYTREISLTHLSVFSGVSENYICSLFKKELDQTFLDYVCKLRLRKAIELLITDTGKNIREISFMLGYRSERQFFRLFKAKTGMTPQQFRETYFNP